MNEEKIMLSPRRQWRIMLPSGLVLLTSEEYSRPDLERDIYRDFWPIPCETTEMHEKDRKLWNVRGRNVVAWS